MYFEDLSLVQMFHITERSRYLFLEFIRSFSLVVVANQGSYDLHIFRILTQLGTGSVESLNGTDRMKLQREYVFKCPRWQERILGVNVVEEPQRSDSLPMTCRVYILTSSNSLHCLEIRRTVGLT